MTSGTVATEACVVVGATHLRFVLVMASRWSHLVLKMGKLTLGPIFTEAVFLEVAAHLSLVTFDG